MQKRFKTKIKRVLAIPMALSMLFCNSAFAADINLVNSTESVATDTLDKVNGTDYFEDETTNEWLDGTISEEVKVIVDLESLFEITIPKEIVLDGETGKADYIVNAKGDIAGDQKLNVVPDAEFTMSEAGGKDNIIATVTQEDTEYTYDLMIGDGTDYNGSVEAVLSAGEWLGKFVFNINFKDVSIKPLEYYSWYEIATISEAGEASNYFQIGDEKIFTLTNGETYTAQIIGIEHDDLADNSGKAGITFQFKELMTTKRQMNSSKTNAGSWKSSKMRNYVNNELYNMLPVDLQASIKSVTKHTVEGNASTKIITTEDKLFLLSRIEVYNACFGDYDEGRQYAYYVNSSNYYKKINDTISEWWLRSPYIHNDSYLHNMFSVVDDTSSNWIRFYANDYTGVAPAFCI